MKKILIMGLPGSGKTMLAMKLINLLKDRYTILWLNADTVRLKYNDWDFSYEGRIRQSKRMADLANECHSDFVICDFVAPLEEMRNIFNPDILVWVDTIQEGRYEDTNKMFEKPKRYDVKVLTQNAELWSVFIKEYILNIF